MHEEHKPSLGLAHPVQQEVRYDQIYVPTPKTHILQAGPSILPLQGYAGLGQVPYMLNDLARSSKFIYQAGRDLEESGAVDDEVSNMSNNLAR